MIPELGDGGSLVCSGSLFLCFTNIYIVSVGVGVYGVGTHVPGSVFGSQVTTGRSWFFPATAWVPGIRLRPKCLVASTFI